MRAWLLLFWVASVHADDLGTRWSSLWQTADQRGEELMRQGNAAAAAQAYSDPRRRAYAELQAGDYAKSARDFAAFDDSDAHYDRGNALAHVGDLASALRAYDTALARDPNNRDARHNRDLVAKALQQQAPPQQGGTATGQNPAQNSAASGGRSQRQPSPARNAEKPGQEAIPGAKQDGGQDLQHDAQPPGQAHPAEAKHARHGGEPQATDALEQQLAQEQWLRQIPDDPGGLLRRKFLIEHLQRQP